MASMPATARTEIRCRLARSEAQKVRKSTRRKTPTRISKTAVPIMALSGETNKMSAAHGLMKAAQPAGSWNIKTPIHMKVMASPALNT